MKNLAFRLLEFKKILVFVIAIFSSYLWAPFARAEFVYLGGGNGAFNSNARVKSLQISSHSEIFNSHLSNHGFKAHLEWSVFDIKGTKSGANSTVVAGVSPVLRYGLANDWVFLEFGIGPYFFSEKMISSKEGVGTTFEFGSLVGVGARFGEKSQFEVGYRLMHFSNAGISSFNPGVDIQQIRFGYRF